MTKIIGMNEGVVETAQRAKRLEVLQKQQPVAGSTLTGDVNAFLKKEVHPSLDKFLLFWSLMDTIKVHGYSRAAMSTIGRATVGTWWTLRETEDLREQASEEVKRQLMSFYNYEDRAWDNIKDFQTPAYKFMLGIMYLRYFGQAAFHIIRDDNTGKLLGLDHLTGLVVPNVDSLGYFKTPSFVQYPERDPKTRVEFEDPREIVFIANPDWEGSPLGGSDIEALAEFALPLDLYLQTTAREYMKNRNSPELIYMLPSDISDDAFDTFVEHINQKFSGPRNVGKNPIAVQGELKVQELDKMPDNLPYAEGRGNTREETMAVSGTHSALLGLGDKVASAALKEIRRHFHETTMEPIFSFLEQALYEQVHVREFEAPEWGIKFNSPDFLNAVERATVHRRYWEIGVLNANEIRHDLGEAPREGGDEYKEDPKEPQGSPPEGREEEPDAPSNVGEPNPAEGDPERGDQHDEETEHALFNTSQFDLESMKVELDTWERFFSGRLNKEMSLREFRTNLIPESLKEELERKLQLIAEKSTRPVEEAKELFRETKTALEAMYYG